MKSNPKGSTLRPVQSPPHKQYYPQIVSFRNTSRMEMN
jgi:hypothetical protein